MKKIKRIVKKFIFGHKSDSITYIKYLKSKGMIIGNNCNIWSPKQTLIDETRPWAIKIGNNVNITTGVKILTHGYDWSVIKGKEGKVYGSYGKVVIGDNVFIGMNTIILKGVRIGNNVIIGAGSVVTKNIKSNSVAVGNPAKVIFSLTEYENKIREKQLEQAFSLFNDYYVRYEKIPDETIFDEFFFLFKNNIQTLNSKELKQLKNTGNLQKSINVLENNKKMFSNFEEFKKYCINKIENRK